MYSIAHTHHCLAVPQRHLFGRRLLEMTNLIMQMLGLELVLAR